MDNGSQNGSFTIFMDFMYPYIVNDPFWDPISGIPHETMGHLRESLASKDPAPEKMSLSLSRACPKVLLRMVFSQSPNIY